VTKITQLPQKIDSNVVIKPPKQIEIEYIVNQGWYILINGVTVTSKEDGETQYWDDAAQPMKWLIDSHLIVTKAYNELDKAVKKVSK